MVSHLNIQVGVKTAHNFRLLHLSTALRSVTVSMVTRVLPSLFGLSSRFDKTTVKRRTARSKIDILKHFIRFTYSASEMRTNIFLSCYLYFYRARITDTSVARACVCVDIISLQSIISAWHYIRRKSFNISI